MALIGSLEREKLNKPVKPKKPLRGGEEGRLKIFITEG